MPDTQLDPRIVAGQRAALAVAAPQYDPRIVAGQRAAMRELGPAMSGYPSVLPKGTTEPFTGSAPLASQVNEELPSTLQGPDMTATPAAPAPFKWNGPTPSLAGRIGGAFSAGVRALQGDNSVYEEPPSPIFWPSKKPSQPLDTADLRKLARPENANLEGALPDLWRGQLDAFRKTLRGENGAYPAAAAAGTDPVLRNIAQQAIGEEAKPNFLTRRLIGQPWVPEIPAQAKAAQIGGPAAAAGGFVRGTGNILATLSDIAGKVPSSVMPGAALGSALLPGQTIREATGQVAEPLERYAAETTHPLVTQGAGMVGGAAVYSKMFEAMTLAAKTIPAVNTFLSRYFPNLSSWGGDASRKAFYERAANDPAFARHLTALYAGLEKGSMAEVEMLASKAPGIAEKLLSPVVQDVTAVTALSAPKNREEFENAVMQGGGFGAARGLLGIAAGLRGGARVPPSRVQQTEPAWQGVRPQRALPSGEAPPPPETGIAPVPPQMPPSPTPTYVGAPIRTAAEEVEHRQLNEKAGIGGLRRADYERLHELEAMQPAPPPGEAPAAGVAAPPPAPVAPSVAAAPASSEAAAGGTAAMSQRLASEAGDVSTSWLQAHGWNVPDGWMVNIFGQLKDGAWSVRIRRPSGQSIVLDLREGESFMKQVGETDAKLDAQARRAVESARGLRIETPEEYHARRSREAAAGGTPTPPEPAPGGVVQETDAGAQTAPAVKGDMVTVSVGGREYPKTRVINVINTPDGVRYQVDVFGDKFVPASQIVSVEQPVAKTPHPLVLSEEAKARLERQFEDTAAEKDRQAVQGNVAQSVVPAEPFTPAAHARFLALSKAALSGKLDPAAQAEYDALGAQWAQLLHEKAAQLPASLRPVDIQEAVNQLDQEVVPPLRPAPLNMAGKARVPRATPELPPVFAALHSASQEKFNAAWDTRDPVAMSDLLQLTNRGLRAEFEQRAGVKLPKTMKGTRTIVESMFAEMPNESELGQPQPVRGAAHQEPAAPANGESPVIGGAAPAASGEAAVPVPGERQPGLAEQPGGAPGDLRAPAQEAGRGVELGFAGLTPSGLRGVALLPGIIGEHVRAVMRKEAFIRTLFPTWGAENSTLDTMFTMKGDKDKYIDMAAGLFDERERMFAKMSKDELKDVGDRARLGQRQRTPELQAAVDDMMAFGDVLYVKDMESRMSLKGRSILNSIPDAEKLGFLKAAQRGTPQATPALQALDAQFPAISRRKIVPYKENYFVRFFYVDKESGIGRIAAMVRGRRNVLGTQGFEHQRTYTTMTEAEAGSAAVDKELASYNPVTLLKWQAADILKHTSALNAWNTFHNDGVLLYVSGPRSEAESIIGDDGFTYDHVDDRIANRFAHTEQGTMLRGRWFMRRDAAQIFNNYVSHDAIRESEVGRTLLAIKQAHVGWMLLGGTFHALNIARQAVMSGAMLAGAQLRRNPLQAAATLVSSALTPVTSAQLGGKIRRGFLESNKPPGSTVEFASAQEMAALHAMWPDFDQYVDDGFHAGLKMKLDDDYVNQVTEAIRAKMAETAAGRAMLGLVNVATMRAMFHTYIPSIKWAVWMKEYHHALTARAAELASGAIRRDEIARDRVRSVENEFGTVNWENFFLPRTTKSGLQLGFLSFQWFGGTGRHVIDAALYVQRVADAWAKGEPMPVKGERAFRWILVSAFMAAVVAEIVMHYFVGHGPETVDDLIAPRVNKDGLRLVFDPYLKELRAMAIASGQFVSGNPFPALKYIESKEAGIWKRGSEILTNADWHNVQVANPDDALWKRAWDKGTHLVGAPIAVSKFAQVQAESSALQILSLLGIQKAPSDIGRSAAEQIMDEYSQQHPSAPLTQAQDEQKQARRKFQREVRGGEAGDSVLLQGLRKGQLDRTLHDASLTPMQARYLGLPNDVALKAYTVMTPAERKEAMLAVAMKAQSQAKRDPLGALQLMQGIEKINHAAVP